MTANLPLVPFERYMLADSTADYPRTFVIEARLSGAIDRQSLETAWRAAVARHPMLRARPAKVRRGWRWVFGDDRPRIDWGDEGVPLAFADGETIDLARNSGVRLWVRIGDNTARLVLQFHHACCDGVGGLQFVGDVLAEYARLTSSGEPLPQLPPLEPELLDGRGLFGLMRPTFREWLGHAWMTMRQSWRLLGRKAVPLALPKTSAANPNTPSPFPGYETCLLDPRESEQLHQTAKQAGATLNDLLMSHLLCTIAQWNAANAPPDASHGWLRINVPTNLRRREDLRMPAANVMSFTFIDRRAQDCRSGAELLDSIRHEMEVIKRRRLGLYFIAQLALVGRVPGGMRLVVSGRRCFATAVLTNLGDATKAFSIAFPRRGDKLVIGNMLLESLVGTPPLRPLTRVGVAVASYAGQLSINVLCDRHHFTREQTRGFLDAYLAQIRKGLTDGRERPEAGGRRLQEEGKRAI